MIRTFDPDTNPYADDLVRLSLAPPGRYSHVERLALARIIASKLYKISLVEPYYTDWSFSSWESETHHGKLLVEIDVIFDSELSDRAPSFRPQRYDSINNPLIVLSAGRKGVVEVFNGLPGRWTFEYVWDAIEKMRVDQNGDFSSELGVILRRSDDEVAGNYVDKGDNDRNGGGGEGDRRNLAGGEGGGGGPGGGGDAPNGVPGSGGSAS